MRRAISLICLALVVVLVAGCTLPTMKKTTDEGPAPTGEATTIPSGGPTAAATPAVSATPTPGSAALPAQDAVHPEAQRYAGDWDTNWGTMTFTIAGSHAHGVYSHDNGTIEADVTPDGRSMAGWWYEEPSRQPPADAGRFYLNLSADGQTFTGSWGYGDDTSAGDWTGTKVDNSGSNSF